MRLARFPHVATSSFPSAMLRTGLLRSTKSSQENPSATLRAGFGVARLGGGGGQVEAQGIGVVLVKEVGHLHKRAAALAQLCPFEVEVFIGKRDKSFPCSLCGWRSGRNTVPRCTTILLVE
jgi:hypothetical protein